MEKARCAFAVAVVAALVSAWVPAKEMFVKAGSDGDGTKEKPYGDLWEALAKASRGDVVRVAEGTYNGKGGSGHFVVKVPNLTLAGGYKADFSARDPFKNLTILERAKDYKGDWTGLPEGFIAGKDDHAGLVVDGFVMNGQTRNQYTPEGDINIKGSYVGKAFEASKANIKVRNCIIVNPLGEGIYVAWQGKENEVSNCFILNTFYSALETRSAQPNSEVRIKNCTFAFCWFYPSKGGGQSVFVGRQGKTILENNVFSLSQTEGGEAGFGVLNGFGNDETVMKGNIFYLCQGGYYKFMDENKQNLILWKQEELAKMNKEGEPFKLAETGGNSDENPGFSPEKDFFEKFSNFVASQPGKLNMDMMNEWRRSVGLPLQAEPGSKRKNYGMAYPLAAVVPGLVSKVQGKGVQIAGPFEEYKAAGGTGGGEATGPAAAKKDYVEAAFESFKKGTAGVKELAGKAVTVKVAMGSSYTEFLLKNAPREDYVCVKLMGPGKKEPTRDYAFGYLLKGSDAAKEWDKMFKKKDKFNEEGITIKGTAYYVGAETYSYPVGVIIDEVSK